MGKILLSILTILLTFSVTQVKAADYGYTINDFRSDITIQENGEVNITESINVDFGQIEKHGIYRYIPYLYEDENHNKTYTKIEIKSVMRDGVPENYSLNKDKSNIILKIGKSNRTVNGGHIYTINYNATGILRKYNDHTQLYWNVTGKGWDTSINKVAVTVKLPRPGIKKAACYEGFSGSAQSCVFNINNRTVNFNNINPLIPGMDITVVTGFANGIVPILKVDPPKTIYELIFNPLSITVFVITLLTSGLFCLRLWWTKGRDKWIKPTALPISSNENGTAKPINAYEQVVVEFTPPESLKPAEIGVLMDERADTTDITATIIDLAVRGYIKIEEIQKKWIFGSMDYRLTRTAKKPAGLERYEELLMDNLFENGNSINISGLKNKFYEDLAEIKKELYSSVIRKKLFMKNPEEVKNKYMILSILFSFFTAFIIFAGIAWSIGVLIAFGSGLFLMSFFALFLSRSMAARSAYGHDLYRRSKGYYLFISGAEKYRQRFYENKNLFNDILPYAIIFGLTSKYAKAMDNIGYTATNQNWYIGRSGFNPAVFANSVSTFSSSFSTAIASAPSKSGGFSSGGSGGGFGGGGGGSW